jgi:hypothetical protein
MGCFQAHWADDDICDMQDKPSNSSTVAKIGNEADKSSGGLIEFNDEEAKLGNKPSEVLVLTPEVTAELLKTYQRV